MKNYSLKKWKLFIMRKFAWVGLEPATLLQRQYIEYANKTTKPTCLFGFFLHRSIFKLLLDQIWENFKPFSLGTRWAPLMPYPADEPAKYLLHFLFQYHNWWLAKSRLLCILRMLWNVLDRWWTVSWGVLFYIFFL